MKDCLVILDFGSQYTHLIKAQLSDVGIYSIIVAGDESYIKFQKQYNYLDLKGIILSGGSKSVYNHEIIFDNTWIQLGLPVLGICYGHQLLVSQLGGKVIMHEPEYGKANLTITSKSRLFTRVAPVSTVWMSHGDSVSVLPKGFISIASTISNKYAAIENSKYQFYGVQFHPEVSHTAAGVTILINFAKTICNIKSIDQWTPEKFIKETSTMLRDVIGTNRIIMGLSGGVDSMTMAALLRKIFPRNQLLAVYVDTGLMPDETLNEVRQFCEQQDLEMLYHDAADQFFSALQGIIDPTQKGKIIGRLFIKVFELVAVREKNIHYFAQGTIWSDVIESGTTKFSSQIKPHHNVGGLPKKLNFVLIEPLRELFKDKVRLLAAYMDLPQEVVRKKVFPGPGFAIRVIGEVTKDKISLVKKCTKIIDEVISQSTIGDKIWMAFAVLIEVQSLGVKGDQRIENSQAIVVRVVESVNSMTVNFSQNAFPFLETISNRIVRETPIGRVVYDITNKPPATIEWQ